ncbi:MAG: hypothetical protein ACPGVG_00330 [Mycobacterium sp.]
MILPTLVAGAAITAATPTAGAEPTDMIPGDGVYQVGIEDLRPGTYHSPGPSNPDGVCTWTTQSRLDNGVSMNSKSSSSQLAVTIPETAFEFETEGCQPWHRVH